MPRVVSTLFLLAVIALVGYVFVYQQRGMIADAVGYATIISILIAVSFLVSAMEAAFTRAHLNGSIRQALNQERERPRAGYEPIAAHFASHGHLELPRELDRRFKRLQRKSRRLARKQKSLAETGRALYIGSLASVSVFLNIAIAVLLPLTLTKISSRVVEMPYPQISLDTVALTLSTEIAWLDVTSQKTLIFVSSTLPVLILGKIVPKELGIRHNQFFAYDLNSVARGVVLVFGFLPRGLEWPLGVRRSPPA